MHPAKSPSRALRIALALLLAGPLLAQAQSQWKWRDSQGRLQYSDLPPPSGTPEQDILQRPPPPSLRPPAPATAAPAAAAPAGPKPPSPAAVTVDPALAARRKEQEQKDADKRKAEDAQLAQQRAENCENARTYLRTLESGQRIARTNVQGEREILDDAARAQESAKARQAIDDNCR